MISGPVTLADLLDTGGKGKRSSQNGPVSHVPTACRATQSVVVQVFFIVLRQQSEDFLPLVTLPESCTPRCSHEEEVTSFDLIRDDIYHEVETLIFS